MVVAKSERAYTVLKRAFKERTVDKTYHALVQGLPDPVVGTIDAPIGRHPGHDYKFAVIAERQAAASPTTRCSRRSGAASLLEIHLETGRTHQIRVHFAALRHPCVGDLTYGADPVLAARLGLRAAVAARRRARASSTPARGSTVRFESPYPEDLQTRPGPRRAPEAVRRRRLSAVRPDGAVPSAAGSTGPRVAAADRGASATLGARHADGLSAAEA